MIPTRAAIALPGLALCCGLLLAPLSAQAQAGDKPRPMSPRSGVTTLAPDKMQALPLTKQECLGLGGKVIPPFRGNVEGCVGEVCATTDRTGTIRVACITEANPD